MTSQKEHAWHHYFIYTKFEEEHGTSRAKKGERDDSSRPDNFETDGPGRGKTKPNAYQTPHQTKYFWHKSIKKTRRQASIFPKEEAEKTAICAQRTSQARSKHNCQKCDTIAKLNFPAKHKPGCEV